MTPADPWSPLRRSFLLLVLAGFSATAFSMILFGALLRTCVEVPWHGLHVFLPMILTALGVAAWLLAKRFRIHPLEWGFAIFALFLVCPLVVGTGYAPALAALAVLVSSLHGVVHYAKASRPAAATLCLVILGVGILVAVCGLYAPAASMVAATYLEKQFCQ